jgi:hypothetical protein
VAAEAGEEEEEEEEEEAGVAAEGERLPST